MILASCSQMEGATLESDESIIEAGREAVRATLKDPDSAQFRNEIVGEHDGMAVACGEVNAANSYGGKVGYQRFVMQNHASVLFEESTDPLIFETAWVGTCSPG
ncbi:MAG: hypothetical protein ACOY7L_17085 [Pseudomonadota bacterium]